jgi:putative ABC transport system permease protein
MSVFYAWHNVFHNRKRAAAALAGIAFSVLLVFMQMGFLDTARRGATMLYSFLDFHILLSSDKYENLDSAGELDLNRLVQASLVPGVAQVAPFRVGRADWEDKDSKLVSTLMLLGSELNPNLFSNQEIAGQLGSIAAPNTVMLDILSHQNYGQARVGREAKINDTDVTVGSLFQLGMGFYREGAALVNSETFQRLMRGDHRKVSLGLVRVRPGADPAQVRKALRQALPSDVVIWGRQELLDKEQAYFLSVKPVGIMFQAGALVSLVVGGVILFQVLSTEISNKLNEFATMKAMGYGDRHIYWVGIQQALLYAGFSYLIAMLGAWGIFSLAYRLSRLPIYFTADLAGQVLAMTLGVCSLSGVLALQKVRRADPAELF